MYLDVLAGDSFGRYNIKLAKLAGLQTAVYWETLLNIITRVVKKKTYNEEGFFKVDRKYVESITTLTVEEQYVCDEALSKLEVVLYNKDNRDLLQVNVKNMLSVLVEDNISDLKKISKLAKVSKADKAAGKKIGVVERVVGLFNETDQISELAVRKLVGVYYDKGIQRNDQWNAIIPIIHEAAHDPDTLTRLVDHILATNYTSIPTAVESFKKTNKTSASRPSLDKQVISAELSDEVF